MWLPGSMHDVLCRGAPCRVVQSGRVLRRLVPELTRGVDMASIFTVGTACMQEEDGWGGEGEGGGSLDQPQPDACSPPALCLLEEGGRALTATDAPCRVVQRGSPAPQLSHPDHAEWGYATLLGELQNALVVRAKASGLTLKGQIVPTRVQPHKGCPVMQVSNSAWGFSARPAARCA